VTTCIWWCLLILWLYKTWRTHFDGKVSRTNKGSPSYPDLPDVINKKENASSPRTHQKNRHHDGTYNHSEQARINARRTSTLTPTDCSLTGCGALATTPPTSITQGSNDKNDDRRKKLEANKPVRLGEEKATKIDMDHVFLDFVSYVAVHLLVYPGMVVVAVCGLIGLKIREGLVSAGMICKEPCDLQEVVANAALESSLVIYYKRRSKADRNIAIFSWNEVPTINQKDGKLKIINDFQIKIDLIKRCLVRAELHGDELTPS
jgi:hypothetical protein